MLFSFNVGTLTAHRTLAALCAALACLLLPNAIGAQTITAHRLGEQFSNKDHPRSFSNGEMPVTSTHGPANAISDVVAEPNTADAVAAAALALIYDQADEHFHKGEYNHCINLNQIVVEGDPHNTEAFADNAYLLWSTDRDALAIATLKKGIAVNPNTYDLFDELGQYYWLHHKDATRAVPYLEQAVKLKCPSLTWHSLARCYEVLGRWDRAADAWRTASSFPPGEAIAKIHLKRAEAELARRQSAGH